jgi:phospholipid/cholesterol/gamma-HCH transport system permease protein
LVVPILVGLGDIIGVMGGFLVATGTLGFNTAAYLQNTANFLQFSDIASSLAKGAVFGGIAAIMGCYYGMGSGRGAQGVGTATKGSVEAAAILILAANFVLTGVFFSS